MGKPIDNIYERTPGGGPASHGDVVRMTLQQIQQASANGTGLNLTAAQVRALDWDQTPDIPSEEADNLWLASDAAAYLAYLMQPKS